GIEVRRATATLQVKEGTFARGSYVVKMTQPYGPLAKTLLEKQVYPDPTLNTYDDSAWTMGLANGVEVKTIEDRAVLDAAADLLPADVVTKGEVRGTSGAASPGVFVVKHNGALSLITLRCRLAAETIKAAKRSFKVDDEEFPAGSLIVPASSRARGEIEKLGLA